MNLKKFFSSQHDVRISILFRERGTDQWESFRREKKMKNLWMKEHFCRSYCWCDVLLLNDCGFNEWTTFFWYFFILLFSFFIIFLILVIFWKILIYAELFGARCVFWKYLIVVFCDLIADNCLIARHGRIKLCIKTFKIYS